METRFLSGINQIQAHDWNKLSGCNYPFLRHEFLAALENSGCISANTGWQAQHLVIEENGQLLAVMPCYIKTHSWGEYVFDWAWADAYRRHGHDYYPKLVSAIPFTPVTGPRLCVAAEKKANTEKITAAAFRALENLASKLGASSFHLLFPEQDHSNAFRRAGMLQRIGAQYHWLNRGYTDFADFLAALSSRKRKNINKERKRVAGLGISFDVREGNEITTELWDLFFVFYQSTYAKRSGHGGYLNRAFFAEIATTLAKQLVMVIAVLDNKPFAGALYFRGNNSLYGRYWGCLQEVENLHFETCYYQGIEYCIRHKIQTFESGAQGEHKIQRGFEPVKTWSNHWLANPDFSDAVEDFLQRETAGIDTYIKEAATLLPFKRP
jgi:predicted N-acyltransferase